MHCDALLLFSVASIVSVRVIKYYIVCTMHMQTVSRDNTSNWLMNMHFMTKLDEAQFDKRKTCCLFLKLNYDLMIKKWILWPL